MQSIRVMGLCSLLAFSAAQANEQGQALVGTIYKQIQGVTLGLPAGAVRAAAHVFVTGPLTSAMYGANNSRIARRVAAVLASAVLHLSVNGAIEKYRDKVASQIEENTCAEGDNCELTNSYAQITDWVTYIALMAYFTIAQSDRDFPLRANHDHRFEAIVRGFAGTPEVIDWAAAAPAPADAALANVI